MFKQIEMCFPSPTSQRKQPGLEQSVSCPEPQTLVFTLLSVWLPSCSPEWLHHLQPFHPHSKQQKEGRQRNGEMSPSHCLVELVYISQNSVRALWQKRHFYCHLYKIYLLLFFLFKNFKFILYISKLNIIMSLSPSFPSASQFSSFQLLPCSTSVTPAPLRLKQEECGEFKASQIQTLS